MRTRKHVRFFGEGLRRREEAAVERSKLLPYTRFNMSDQLSCSILQEPVSASVLGFTTLGERRGYYLRVD